MATVGYALKDSVTGAVPVAQGGSGATTLTGYLKGNGTSAFTTVATVPASDVTGGVGVLSTTTGIDGKTVGTTNLYTVPGGKTAIITNAIIRITTATGLTGNCKAGIGIAAGETDIFASQALTGFDATTKHFEFIALGTKVNALSTEVIKLGIDVGFTATTATLAVSLIGYLL